MDFTRGGVLELRYVYHNRQDGLVDWIELQDGQAVLQSTYHFQYDNQGRVSSEESRDTAGTATLRIAYHYNAHGVLETTDRDTDADGDVDARTTHVYDAQGRRVEDATDNDLDGTVDATVSYVNNELGDPERVTTTAPGYTAIDHYQYGLPGRVSTIDTDFVGDGEVDRRSTYHYDADGRWSSSDGDAQVDGTVDWRWVVSYDC